MILERKEPGSVECGFIRKLRESGVDLPVVVLYSEGTADRCIDSLNEGADDYLKKPFEIKELVARVNAIKRRSSSSTSRLLRFADVELDEISRKVTRSGDPIHLSQTEFKLLVYLVRNKGRIVPKKEIIEEVWGINFETGTNVVDVYISYLRRAVDAGYPKKLIHTIHGEGIILME
jgi:DNA-binding response OmpR family regulator